MSRKSDASVRANACNDIDPVGFDYVMCVRLQYYVAWAFSDRYWATFSLELSGHTAKIKKAKKF